MEWSKMTTESIISGKNADGVSFLELFAQDYCKVFNTSNFCVTCPNKIKEAHLKWIKKHTIMKKNNSKYVLKEKYDGIFLKFGSNIRVNNATMTEELGAELLKNRGEKIFAKFPKPTTKKTKVDENGNNPDSEKEGNV